MLAKKNPSNPPLGFWSQIRDPQNGAKKNPGIFRGLIWPNPGPAGLQMEQKIKSCHRNHQKPLVKQRFEAPGKVDKNTL